jgi:hypothetical protein
MVYFCFFYDDFLDLLDAAIAVMRSSRRASEKIDSTPVLYLDILQKSMLMSLYAAGLSHLVFPENTSRPVFSFSVLI